MFVEAFLGCLLALVVFAAAKWTLLNPIASWSMRRSTPELIDYPDFAKLREEHAAKVAEEKAKERKLLAAEIARELSAQETNRREQLASSVQ